MFSNTHHTEFSMKIFLTLIAFTCALVPAIHGMETSLPESKSLKRSCDVIDLTNDVVVPLVNKKQKTEEGNAVVSSELAKTIAGYSEKPLHSNSGYIPKFTPVKSKNVRNKPFTCPRCETSFINEKSLTAHNTWSYCGKKAQNKNS